MENSPAGLGHDGNACPDWCWSWRKDPFRRPGSYRAPWLSRRNRETHDCTNPFGSRVMRLKYIGVACLAILACSDGTESRSLGDGGSGALDAAMLRRDLQRLARRPVGHAVVRCQPSVSPSGMRMSGTLAFIRGSNHARFASLAMSQPDPRPRQLLCRGARRTHCPRGGLRHPVDVRWAGRHAPGAAAPLPRPGPLSDPPAS